MSSQETLVRHTGGCHCGQVRYEVYAPQKVVIVECNCSICKKKQNFHFIVPEKQFKILQGEENLTCYTFNTHQAKHLFCRTCGVQSFYRPRSNPDGYGIMPHCIDEGTLDVVEIRYFDGDNWEQCKESNTWIDNMSKAE